MVSRNLSTWKSLKIEIFLSISTNNNVKCAVNDGLMFPVWKRLIIPLLFGSLFSSFDQSRRVGLRLCGKMTVRIFGTPRKHNECECFWNENNISVKSIKLFCLLFKERYRMRTTNEDPAKVQFSKYCKTLLRINPKATLYKVQYVPLLTNQENILLCTFIYLKPFINF